MESKILIVIPAYNEGNHIRSVVEEVKSAVPKYDVLVINDGSVDNTADEAKATGAQVVTLPYNMGIGKSVQTGYRFAMENGFDIMVQFDGDGQHDISYLDKVIRPVLENNCDMCVGSRFLTKNQGYRSSLIRRVGIRFFSHLIKWLTGIKMTDPTSGFRACNRKLIKRFAAYYPEDYPEPEAILIASRMGAKIREVDVQMRERMGGKSSIRNLKTIYYMIKVTTALLIARIKKEGDK